MEHTSGPRACTACASSKTKCVFPSDEQYNGRCSRCNRLNKTCVMQKPVVRVRKKRITRVAKLEEKVEGLVSLLKSTQTAPDRINETDVRPSQLQGPRLLPNNNNNNNNNHHNNNLTESCQAQADKGQTPDPDFLLSLFRDHISSQFPFVIIPNNVTANDLRRTKPFLYKIIIIVYSVHDVASQTTTSQDILKDLTNRMVLGGEFSLDLLQGLLVFIPWYHFHVHVARRLTVLYQLAASLLIDLGLNREFTAQGLREHGLRAGFRVYHEDTAAEDIKPQRTLEERRAYLGVMFLNTVIGLYMRHIDAMSFGKYAEDCVKLLEDTMEYPSDELLVQLVHLMRIGGEIRQSIPRESLSTMIQSSVPLDLVSRTLKSKLLAFRAKLPSSVQQNPHVLVHYHGLMVYLTETPLFVPAPTFTRPALQSMLATCLTSSKSVADTLFSIQGHDFKFTYPAWAPVSHTLFTLAKLSLFVHDDWDLTFVRETLDLSRLLAELIPAFQRMRVSGMMLERITLRFANFKEVFEKKRAELLGESIQAQAQAQVEFRQVDVVESGSQQQQQQPEMGMGMQALYGNYPMDGVLMDDFGPLGDTFWEEIMGGDWQPLRLEP